MGRAALKGRVALVLLVGVAACAKIGPGVNPGASQKGLGDASAVVLVLVQGLLAADLETEHPDGGPLLPALAAGSASAARWMDVLPTAAGAAGAWSTLGGQDPRLALESPPAPWPPVAPGWTTRLLAVPPTLGSEPEALVGDLAGAPRLDTQAALRTLHELVPSPRELTCFVLDPWPPAVGGAPVVNDRRLQPRVERLRRLDAPLSAAVGRLARQGATVIVGGLLAPPAPSGVFEVETRRDREDLRLPLLVWSHATAFESGDHSGTVHQRDLHASLVALARGKRDVAPLFQERDGPRISLWWTEDRGGAWWEEGDRAVHVDETGARVYRLQRDGTTTWTEPLSGADPTSTTLARAFAELDGEERTWTLWVKGSDQLDLVEIEASVAGTLMEVRGVALEEIDELRRTGPSSAHLYFAAEPDGDAAHLRTESPASSLHLHTEGTFHPQPIFGAPYWVGPKHRSLGVREVTVRALSRPYWLARASAGGPDAPNWADAPAGVHVLRTTAPR